MTRACLHRRLLLPLLAGLSLLLMVERAAAQNPTQAVDRAQLLRAQPSLRDEPTSDDADGGETVAASPNDPDLGEQAILKRSERYRAFTFYASTPISYTSNVALARTNEQEDLLFTPSVGVAYAPKITSTLYGNFSIGQQFFHYDKFSELDFGSLDARAGLTYLAPKLRNLLLRADYAYNRLTSDGYDEFFSIIRSTSPRNCPSGSAGRSRSPSGADASISIASSPDEPARHDFSPFVAYAVKLTRELTLAAVGRVAWREYVEGDRSDVSGILALSATYRFTEAFSANAIATFATSDSNQDAFDYDVANVGLALSLAVRF
jgi:hypothetical protein